MQGRYYIVSNIHSWLRFLDIHHGIGLGLLERTAARSAIRLLCESRRDPGVEASASIV